MKNYDLFAKKNLNFLDILHIPFYYSRGCSIALLVLSFFNGFIPLISLKAISSFIDSMALFVKEGIFIGDIYIYLSLIVISLIYTYLYPIISDYVKLKLKNSLSETFTVELVETIGTLKYKYFENPESLDMISRIVDNTETYLSDSYLNLLRAGSLIIKILSIIFFLFVKIPQATFIITLVSIPGIFLAIKAGKVNYKASIDQERHKRYANYFSGLLTGRDFVKERSLFNYSQEIKARWYEEYEKARIIKRKASLKWLSGSEISGLLTSFLIGLIILIILNPLKKGNLTFGTFVAIVNAIISLIPNLSRELPEYSESLSNSMNFLHYMEKLINLDKDLTYLSLPSKERFEIKSIEFKNLSFKYPGTDRYVLHKLNFTMNDRKHYALVGKNGCGKSTLIKILTGLYDEYEGEVHINGISLKNYKNEELKAIFSVIYQDYAKYGITIRENIELGDVNNFDNGINEKKINRISRSLGIFDLSNTLSKGLDTPLGKIKRESVDLSGGQWQKIAIARAMMSDAPVRILDEPTSNLDPFSENDLYEIFKRENKDKLAIFISHRLASTVFADKIFVFDEGRLVEEGDYKSLMSIDGLYRQMFNEQKKWYEDEK